jgi:enoyl-CoA hydratase/carnithine racemase
MSRQFEDLVLETRGAVTRITIDRPVRMNTLRMTVTDRALGQALDAIARDRTTKVVVITGAGERAFCAGWDMERIDDVPLVELEAMVRANLELFFKVWNFRAPVVAAINGYALGAGSALALACDLALAVEHARLGEPEVRHGALSPFLILPFLTHARAVHELSYFGDMLDAHELHRLGLVNRVLPAAGFEDAVWRYAERLARVPAVSLEMTKRSLRAAYDAMGASTAIRQHALADSIVIGAGFPEQKALLDVLAKEGMRAFLAARDGPFRDDC